MIGIAHAADPDILASTHDAGLAADMWRLPPDHPKGINSKVTLVSLKQVRYLKRADLATFTVDYAPGGYATLHRSPASGYVLVHVLLGAIRAKAWQAGLGTYRVGQTWIVPAFANDITAVNASSTNPASTLVIELTDEEAAAEAPAPETRPHIGAAIDRGIEKPRVMRNSASIARSPVSDR
jgi:quercetin dioxygenase-like cupin family protein